MPKVVRRRSLAASAPDVWRVVADPEHLPRWWPRTSRVENVHGSGEGALLDPGARDARRPRRARRLSLHRLRAREPRRIRAGAGGHALRARPAQLRDRGRSCPGGSGYRGHPHPPPTAARALALRLADDAPRVAARSSAAPSTASSRRWAGRRRPRERLPADRFEVVGVGRERETNRADRGPARAAARGARRRSLGVARGPADRSGEAARSAGPAGCRRHARRGRGC